MKDKALATCNILGVNIAVTDMQETLCYIQNNLSKLKGNYICVSNVHTTVMSYENKSYCAIQNGGLFAIPDGNPLSVVSKMRGYKKAKRVTGPDLMGELFKLSETTGYTHYFYGSTQETLEILAEKLKEHYPGLKVAGMYSPPYKKDVFVESDKFVREINELNPDFFWVGLGAPKQEEWMAIHKGKINGIMIGVGAGFNYYAENLKRAPRWMQKMSLEWVYRLIQDPKRLAGRYCKTNCRFLWLVLMGK